MKSVLWIRGAGVVPRINNRVEHFCCETEHKSLKASNILEHIAATIFA